MRIDQKEFAALGAVPASMIYVALLAVLRRASP